MTGSSQSSQLRMMWKSSSQVEANRKKTCGKPQEILMKEVLCRNWVLSCLRPSFWKTWDCDCFRHLPNAGRLQIQALGLGPFNPSTMREWPKKKHSWQQMVAGSQWIRRGKKATTCPIHSLIYDECSNSVGNSSQCVTFSSALLPRS